jgi:hypothetical protein
MQAALEDWRSTGEYVPGEQAAGKKVPVTQKYPAGQFKQSPILDFFSKLL